MHARANVRTISSGQPPATGPRYWVVVISQHAADAAVAGGYLEAGFGKAGPLERMAPGDGVVVYSPRERDDHGAPVQAFTALGIVAPGALYQWPHDPKPFRRAMQWLPAAPAGVRPLIDALGFIRNKAHWGTAFRFGVLRIPAVDFAHLAAVLQVAWPDALAPIVPEHDHDDRVAREGAVA